MKLVHWIFGVCLFTASCDLILNFNLGGSVRLSQLLMILVCLAAVARALQDGRILWPRGANALALWVFIQFLFVPLSGELSIGLKFFFLLLFTCICLLAVIQVYGRDDSIELLMRIYLGSYVFVAVYGLLQCGLPLVGVTAPLTVQWIVHGRIARINGFSYEPSYYATYLVLGWIMLVELRLSKAAIVQGRFWKWATVLVSASFFLSTSKTAWLIMLVELLSRLLPKAWRSLGYAVRSGRIRVYVPSSRHLIYIVLLGILALAGIRYGLQIGLNAAAFLSGSGLANTPTHSLDDRMLGFLNTVSEFEDSPFVGRSLGGVGVQMAARNGIKVTSIEELHSYQGFPVILEVLVASGIFGVIPFLVFLYTCTFGGLRMAKRYWPEERAKWLRAMARAMIFEWLMLSADQNLLRVYLWFHFSMVMLVAYHLEFAPAPEAATSRSATPNFPSFEVPSAL